jgi:hypothetical protein
MVKVAALVGLGAAIALGLHYAEGYVATVNPVEDGDLVLLDVPAWVNYDLKNRVVAAAGGPRLPITEETAEVVNRNLDAMTWLDEIEVQVTHEAVDVKAHWRRPLALLTRGPSRFYVDAELVVLDYMPMAHLPIVEITGVTMGLPPAPGAVFDRDDLAAAVMLIDVLSRMDAEVAPRNPLLEQIASIDVSNFKGRRNHRDPHIVLHSKDSAEIIWGAEIGEWGKYLEATDEEKLAKLYAHYSERGALGDGVKYINLRDPQDKVTQPIDRYR